MLATAIFLVSLFILSLIWLTMRTARGVEQRLPPIGKFVDLPEARLHVLDRGVAGEVTPPVLMLHGLGGQLHHFAYHLVDAIARHTRVVTLDRPGSGYSSRREGAATTLRQQADTFVALLDRLNINKAFVVGHSLGGALALALAIHHPTRVAGLALITPLAFTPPEVPKAFRALDVGNRIVRRIIAWTLATPGFMLSRDKVLPAIFGPDPVPKDFAVRAGGILAMRPSQFVATSEDLRALPDNLPELITRYDELRQDGAPPISILVARQDRILDSVNQGIALADSLQGTHLEIVEGGHMLPVTQPERVVQFVEDALKRSA
ncbi:MAG: alpha/beta fold hydrolase [Steroidobacteraceae bacterium]